MTAPKRKKKRCYFVSTWDSEIQRFTPQVGVKYGPYTQFGIRKPLRRLREMGYGVGRESPSVLVERIDQ